MVTILDNQIAVYIPSTNGNRQIDSARYIERALKLFVSLFGGSTIESQPRQHSARGVWTDSSGFGQRGEAALTVQELREYCTEHLTDNYSYALGDIGQFQVNVNVFRSLK